MQVGVISIPATTQWSVINICEEDDIYNTREMWAINKNPVTHGVQVIIFYLTKQSLKIRMYGHKLHTRS